MTRQKLEDRKWAKTPWPGIWWQLPIEDPYWVRGGAGVSGWMRAIVLSVRVRDVT